MQALEPGQWCAAVSEAMAAGYTRFVTLMGVDDGGAQLWLRLRNAEGAEVVLVVDAQTPVPSLTAMLPAVDWYEREAVETFGLCLLDRDPAPLLLEPGAAPHMRKLELLPARQSTPWPGEKDPGGTTPRRRTLPPGVEAGAR